MADGEWRPDSSGPYAERFFLADGSATRFYRDRGTVVEVSEGGVGSASSETSGSPGSNTWDPPSVDPEQPANQTLGQNLLVNGGDSPVSATGSASRAPKTYRSRSVVIAVAVVVVLGGIAIAVIASRHSDANATPGSSGRSSTGGSASVRSLTGTLEVDYPTATQWSGAGGACSVPLAYGAETDGDQVVVTSGSGNTLATGTLESGTVVDESASDPNGPGCSFSFTVTGLPNSAFYDVTIDGHRSQEYSLNQLQGEDWNVRLSLVP